MLIDAYDKAYEIKDQENLSRIQKLGHQGEKIAVSVGDNNLSRCFKMYS
jgi:hypothetical protein